MWTQNLENSTFPTCSDHVVRCTLSPLGSYPAVVALQPILLLSIFLGVLVSGSLQGRLEGYPSTTTLISCLCSLLQPSPCPAQNCVQQLDQAPASLRTSIGLGLGAPEVGADPDVQRARSPEELPLLILRDGLAPPALSQACHTLSLPCIEPLSGVPRTGASSNHHVAGLTRDLPMCKGPLGRHNACHDSTRAYSLP